MVPMIPPLVTTTSPFFSADSIFCCLFALPLHREEQQEIENSEDEKDREESQQAIELGGAA